LGGKKLYESGAFSVPPPMAQHNKNFCAAFFKSGRFLPSRPQRHGIEAALLFLQPRIEKMQGESAPILPFVQLHKGKGCLICCGAA
jgi:hypothetical protein